MRSCMATRVVGLLILPALALAQEPQPVPEVAPGSGRAPVPRLVLSTTEWDFGAKWHGEPCTTDITIGNAGEAPLKILRVQSSCGCMVARPKSGGTWKNKVIAPGESESVTLTYNTRKHKRHVSQTIVIETNDPQQPQVTIQIQGEVKYLFEAKPTQRITFGRLARDSRATKSIELRNNMDEKVFLEFEAPEEDIPFSIKLEQLEAGMAYKLSATTKPPLKLGANSVNVELKTRLEDFPVLVFPVSAYVAPRVDVKPSKLYVTPQVKERLQRIVRVMYPSEQPVEVTGIKSSHPELIKAELLPAEQAALQRVRPFHTIRVWLPPADELPEGGGRLEIYTNDPEPEYQKLVVEVKQRAVPAGPKAGATPEEKPEGE
jgi:hypothetical protein